MTIFLTIILFSVLVLAHEAGHFFIAKRAGIRVQEFGFGYPPRIFGVYRDKTNNKLKVVWGSLKKRERVTDKEDKRSESSQKDIEPESTIYSLNLIPFGGFVRLLGENRGEEGSRKKDSFSSQGAIKRSAVILGGVSANIIFAMLLLMIMFSLGAPVAVEKGQKISLRDEKVTVMQISPHSPAEAMGLQIGDEILSAEHQNEEIKIKKIGQLQRFINAHKGEKIILNIKRGKEALRKEGIPRPNPPKNQGALGIALARVGIVSYPWYQAIWKGFAYTFKVLWMIIVAFYLILRNLLVHGKMIGTVAGPVGIFRITSEMANLGWSYFLHFAALISLNLAVLNAFPFPALDGGRFLFILIEKVKGSPINAKVENTVNGIGFALLILLMIVVTVRDVIKLF